MINITNIIECIVYIIAIVCGVIVIPLLKTKLGSIAVGEDKTALDVTLKWLEIAVQAAEEAARSGLIDKRAKYGYALDILERQGITFDEATVRPLIDATVWQLFNQFKDDAEQPREGEE